MKIYVVMTERPSPIALTSPRMHSAYYSRKEAKRACEVLSSRAVSNEYWIESVKLENGS